MKFNGYLPFYNENSSNILDKNYMEIYKDNNKQTQKINSIRKTFRSKLPFFNHKSQVKTYNKEKDNKKEIKTVNDILSYQNNKNRNFLFNKINQYPSEINTMEIKLFEFKNNNNQILPFNKTKKENYHSKINSDNFYFKKKDIDIDIERIKFLMKQKENRTFHCSVPRKKNTTLNNDKLSNCFTIYSIKNQEISTDKKFNRTLDSKNKFPNKFSTKKNNWKISTLPQMYRTNNFNDKPKIAKLEEKTFYNVDKKYKTYSEQIKSLLFPKGKKKNKFKNLVSYDILSLPGSENGKQKINQDTYFVLPNINNTQNCKIFGVFDGHGDRGDIFCQEIRDYFIEYFSNTNIYNQNNIIFNNNFEILNKISNDENLEKVYNLFNKNKYDELNKLYENINKKIHEKYKENDFCIKNGATTNILIVMNDKKKDCLNKIISLNLGDSKSLLITEDNQAIELNICHVPEEISEKERIEKNGGEISRVDWADYGPLRVYFKGKNYPGLAMTRSFGDFNAEPLGINSIPDIKEYDIYDKKPKIIVLATDGIWQFLSNEKVKNILLPYYEENNIRGASQKLVSSALRMWEIKNPDFIDDITVILLFFK